MAIVDFVLVVPEVERVVLAMNILANIALIGGLRSIRVRVISVLFLSLLSGEALKSLQGPLS